MAKKETDKAPITEETVKDVKIKNEEKLYIYLGDGIEKKGFVVNKKDFINQSTYNKMKAIEEFKEDMNDFKDFDEYVAKGGK